MDGGFAPKLRGGMARLPFISVQQAININPGQLPNSTTTLSSNAVAYTSAYDARNNSGNIAIGYGSIAGESTGINGVTSALAVGSNAKATTSGSVALGAWSNVSGNNAIHINNAYSSGSQVAANYSISLGSANVTGSRTIAIGGQAGAISSSNCIVMYTGSNQTLHGSSGVFLGWEQNGAPGTASNTICISSGGFQGSGITGTASNSIYINSAANTNWANTKNNQIILGNGTRPTIFGQVTTKPFKGTLASSNQRIYLQWERSTTNATSTELFLDEGSNTERAKIFTTDSSTTGTGGTLWFVEVIFTAIQTAGAAGTVGDSYVAKVSGVFKNINGTVSAVGSVSASVIANDAGAAAWAVGISADNTNKSLKVEVVGEASKTITWVAHGKIHSAGY